MFKKTVVAAVLVSISMAAQARDTFELGYRWDTPDSGTDRRNVTVGWNTTVAPGWKYNLNGSVTQRDDNSVLQSRVRTGLTYQQGWAYVQANVGRKFVSGGDDQDFYQGEVGVSAPLSHNSKIKVGYRYRDEFSGADDLQKGIVTSITYNLNPTWSVIGKYDHVTDGADVDTQRFGIAVSKSF